ncbi:S8 family peptidase, partial [Streptomyces sp. TRM70308]|uniref:S8 family peptidase n=1 Tax=Streptomyces sp. TRM70308 TaxID=3131932 RepID=UPI003D059C1C
MKPVRTYRRRLTAWCTGLAATAALVGVALPATAQAAEGAVINAGAPGAIEGQYIVALEGGTSLAASAEARVSTQAEDLVAQYGGSVESVYSAVLRGFAADMTADQAKRLAADPQVRYVQQSLLVRAADAGTQPDPPSWGLDRVDGEQDSAYAYPGTGEGVTAYVLDSGIRTTHQTFEGRASHGYDFVDEDGTAQDCNGHGTHVAGTIGGKEYGVAKKVDLVAVRVLGCDGSAPDRDTIEGLDWVAKNAKGPAVGNMSLTSGGANAEPQAMREATKRAIDAGIQFAIAAGNSSTDACGTSPSDVPEAVTLGSTDRNDGRSSFSNYGRCLDLFAPGGNITSASHSSDTGSATMSGTSMASPHAAGALALYLEGHPDATPRESRDAVVEAAEQGVVGNPGSGSPNLLLNVTELGG